MLWLGTVCSFLAGGGSVNRLPAGCLPGSICSVRFRLVLALAAGPAFLSISWRQLLVLFSVRHSGICAWLRKSPF
uniref:Uncharacterized protein n=1 Tax=Arundo donax TaxID=35708 RepID=A0A0A8Y6Z4_ARUDO